MQCVLVCLAFIFPIPTVSLADLARFPSKEEARRNVKLGLRLQNQVRTNPPRERFERPAGEGLDDQIGRCWRTWGLLENAWPDPRESPEVNERAKEDCLRELRALRKRIGPEAYRKGQMPKYPAVPEAPRPKGG